MFKHLKDLKYQIQGTLFLDKLEDLRREYQVEITRIFLDTSLTDAEYLEQQQKCEENINALLKLCKRIAALKRKYKDPSIIQEKLGKALQKIKRKQKQRRFA